MGVQVGAELVFTMGQNMHAQSKILLLIFSLVLVSSTFAAQKNLSNILEVCENHLVNNALTSGKFGNALDCYQAILSDYPGNQIAQRGIKIIEQRFVSWANKAILRKNAFKLDEYIAKLKKINSNNSQLQYFENSLKKIQSFKLTGLTLCDNLFLTNNITSGKHGNAIECYKDYLIYHPNNNKALLGIKKIEDKFIHWAETAIKRQDRGRLGEYIEKLSFINPDSEELKTFKRALQNIKIKQPFIKLFDDLNHDNIINQAELSIGDQNTIDSAIFFPGAIAGDMLEINDFSYTLTEDDIQNGFIRFKLEPQDNYTLVIKNNNRELVKSDLKISFDLHGDKPTIEFIGDKNQDGVFNLTEIQAGIPEVIGAKVSFSQDAKTIHINGVPHPIKTIWLNKGYMVYPLEPKNELNVNIVDKAGNQSATTSRQVNYDIEIYAGDVDIDNVSADNLIDYKDSNQKFIPVMGHAHGGDIKTGDKIEVTLGQQVYSNTINSDGSWLLNIPSQTLLKYNSIQAKVYSVDTAANKVISISSELNYQIDNLLPQVNIYLFGDKNKDGIFNIAEIKAGKPDVIGARIGFVNVEVDDQLFINNEKMKIKQEWIGKGYFVYPLKPEKKISAYIVDKNGNQSVMVNVQPKYDIEVESGKVQINPINDDNPITSGESPPHVTLSGTASGGDISIGDNVEILLNKKTYHTKVDQNGIWLNSKIDAKDLLNKKTIKVVVKSFDKAMNPVVSAATHYHQLINKPTKKVNQAKSTKAVITAESNDFIEINSLCADKFGVGISRQQFNCVNHLKIRKDNISNASFLNFIMKTHHRLSKKSKTLLSCFSLFDKARKHSNNKNIKEIAETPLICVDQSDIKTYLDWLNKNYSPATLLSSEINCFKFFNLSKNNLDESCGYYIQNNFVRSHLHLY